MNVEAQCLLDFPNKEAVAMNGWRTLPDVMSRNQR